jgi:hypothetical protein
VSGRRITEDLSDEAIVKTIAELSLTKTDAALSDLTSFLKDEYIWFGENNLPLPLLASLALLQKSSRGVQALKDKVLGSESDSDGSAIGHVLEVLWYAAHGHLAPTNKPPLRDIALVPPLNRTLSEETIQAARKAFFEIVEEGQINESLFQRLFIFQFQAMLSAAAFNNEASEEDKRRELDTMRSLVFELFAEPAIKITRRLFEEFKELIRGEHTEETYQQFLSKHPVFVDPLASNVIPKQRLGVEHITDFVVRRLDNEYVVVEIEKPQDAIFTSANDFTAKFTHAYGQVIDFQEWVDANGAYARTLMPEISSPRGMLIMGLRENLTPAQIAKLKRFNFNSRAVEVLTFDDLATKANSLYENIHRLTLRMPQP